MNNKITLPALAAILAVRSGLSKRACEEFLRELFDLVARTLETGESVKIQDLGTFRLTEVEPRMSVDVSSGEPIEIPGHRKVVFVPDKELAVAINEPFEAFEPLEIPDTLNIPDENEVPEETEVPAEIEEPAETEVPEESDRSEESEGTEESDVLQENDRSEESELPDELGVKEEIDGQPEIEGKEEVVEQEETVPEEKEEAGLPLTYTSALTDGPELEPRRRRFGFGWGFVAGFITCLAAAGLIAMIWALCGRHEVEAPVDDIVFDITEKNIATDSLQWDSLPPDDPSIVDAEEIEVDGYPEGTVPQVPTQPSDSGTASSAEEANAKAVKDGQTAADDKAAKKVYDTVSPTRYLTIMAKEHYGNYHLWPYIYEENKAFLGHPDRIRPGTRVVIPPLSKYGVNPKSRADIEKAKKMGADIYARYAK